MQIKARLWQQRRQLERSEAVSGNFGVAVESRLAVYSLVASVDVIEEILRLFHRGLAALCPGHDSLGRVRPDQLRPIFLQQVRAGEDVSPDQLAVDCDRYADRVLVAQLLNQALVVALDGLGDGIDSLLHFLIGHHARVRSGTCQSRRPVDCYGLRHRVSGLPHFRPHFLLVLFVHGFGAYGRRGYRRRRRYQPADGFRPEPVAAPYPAARFYAEDSEVDWVAFSGDNAVFTDDAILFSSGHDLTGQKDQRPFGVVDQYQLIDLWPRRPGLRPANQGRGASRFRHDHFAGAQTFIQREEFPGVVRPCSHDRKDSQVSVPDGLKHDVAGYWGHCPSRGRARE